MIAFLTNRIADLKPHQTTTRLVAAGLGLGKRIALVDVLGLSIHAPDDVRARAVVMFGPTTPEAICERAHCVDRETVSLTSAELLLIRTSPGRDIERAWAHQLALQAARLVRNTGVAVANDPSGLERASSKLYSACLPADLTPRTIVAHEPGDVVGFVAELGGPAVLKPLLGSQGRDVFFISDDTNLAELARLLGRTGYLLVQEYLPEATSGDIRVLILDGEVLEAPTGAAAVRRMPRAGEFRSNVALGAQVSLATLTDSQREVCRRAGAVLAADGIRFAGLDLVGEKIVEANVYSTGGLVDAERFLDAELAPQIVAALLGRPG